MSYDELPEGWARARLGEVVAPSKEKIEPSECPDSLYLSLEHIESHTARIVGSGKGVDVESTKAIFHAGDVLYGKLRPYLNKVCIPDFDGICSTDILVFPNSPSVENRYLMRFLMQPEVVEYANHNSNGIQLPRISFDKLAELPFKLPPLAEQQRIVAKVEALLAGVNAARQRLGKVPAILKRFRQSVLAAACSGRLTVEWREDHTPTASGDDWRSCLLEQRKRALANNGNTKHKDPATADADYLEEIPNGWAIVSLDELTTLVTSGSRDWSKYYGSGTGTFIMAQNVRKGFLDMSFRQPVDPPHDDRDRKRSQVSPGDLLVTIVGANTGDVCFVDRPLSEHYVCQSVAMLRPIHSQFAPYVNLFLNCSEFGAGQFQRYIYGEGRPHLGFDHIRMTAIALPSLAEQQEIVRRVETLFNLADAIEKRIAAATARAEKLTQAILAKAFRGELVPTEAELARREGRDYEPASSLLERIRAERLGKETALMKERKPRRRASRIE